VLLLGGDLYVSDLLWSGVGGVGGLVGLVLLYRGLSMGAMAIVAPISAVTGALVPLGFGLLTEGPPPTLALVGALCAVVAIALVSLGPSGGRSAGRAAAGRVVLIALTSGALFGIFFVLLAQTHGNAGMWPLVGARAGSVLVGLAALATTRSGLTFRPATGWLIVAGIGDTVANGSYLLAASNGLLSVVAPIAALYPVSTVLLALVLDSERVRPVQVAGLGLAAAALVLTAI